MTERNDLLTVAEVAALLQVTVPWVHARIARGGLPAVVVGGKRHVWVVDLDAWIEAQRVRKRPSGRRN